MERRFAVSHLQLIRPLALRGATGARPQEAAIAELVFHREPWRPSRAAARTVTMIGAHAKVETPRG
jgi:hypothetical protein